MNNNKPAGDNSNTDFPDYNPYPVFRIASNGKILYSNKTGTLLLEEYDMGSLKKDVVDSLEKMTIKKRLISFGETIFEIAIVPTDNGFANFYGIDVTDHKKREEELKKAKEAADEANRAKVTFLRTVSHEMRTPLTTMKAVLEPKALDSMDDNEKPEYLAIAYKETIRLASIVEDILDMARIELGKIKITPEPVYASMAIEEIIEQVRPLASKKDIYLDFKTVSDSPIVHVEQKRLSQILVNLLGNAIKFTPAKGEITVTVEQEGEFALFTIKDTGCGIPLEKQDLIFKAFEQVYNSPSRQYSGTGLGLAITKRLVELHGGWIKVKSQVNEGSAFTFAIPIFKEERSNENINS